ncbi:PREDICTED: uncharacterized protein LOC104594710 [Nelumbo nucifera]|uniref:Uncharacterized protein LOC104594710 n=2 Tax=Nelumbo nucifera TaxID=4432 RepID=A0A1U7ZNS1_NELNU|nr:PREDICTED: uncharacterized protein LOC104594710 [Nelumbo nucifera]XP_010253442.1 PREDICTED: uncharacterized protein LOC104594710 [Nelumbo nucifera]XP_019052796.1 PREDICTED: uncharacterized protein LOC104594710 [Nelumbo nucifera]DAD26012.1 TPA_asm: hypothetical protein HUJ06_027480 [Nelumbo nucifera]
MQSDLVLMRRHEEQGHQGKKMLNAGSADGIWREKMMKGDNGLKTIECLRGRLLAERVASRVAREEAELMGNKLIELERRIRAEIRSRNRAERKLKLLTKKLESLKLPHVLDWSSSSEKSEDSRSSSTTSSGRKDPDPIKCGCIEEEEETRNAKCPSSTPEGPRSDDVSEDKVAKLGHGGISNSAEIVHSCNNNSSRDPSPGQPCKIETISSKELVTDDARYLNASCRRQREFQLLPSSFPCLS